MDNKTLISHVQRSLWSKGYRVKDAAEFYANPKFDLLVESKTRVKVFERTPSMPMNVDTDLSAVVTFGTGAFKGRISIVFMNETKSFKNAREAFGLPASRSNTYEAKKEGKGEKKASTKKNQA